MKVLLIQDVYKLGHAGDVKSVAAGYGRNYLIPEGLAVLATPGALKQAERIREEAARQRAILNKEMSGLAEMLEGLEIAFPARAGETGKLYGSVTTRMIAEKINEELGTEISHREVDSQPLRTLGEHSVSVRLTVDLVPEVDVLVYREGESPESARAALAEAAEAEAEETEGEMAAEAEQLEEEPVEGEVEMEEFAEMEAVADVAPEPIEELEALETGETAEEGEGTGAEGAEDVSEN